MPGSSTWPTTTTDSADSSSRPRGLATGQCTSDDSYDWLSITNAWTAGDARPADLEGRITPVWGLHLIDMNLTTGDLVARQADQIR